MEKGKSSLTWLLGDLNFSVSENLFSMSSAETTLTWVIFTVELPTICLAVYGLYFLISSDRAAPIFVINLLISDLIQICAKPAMPMPPRNDETIFILFLYITSIWSSIGFMLCICLERYNMIAHPIWYRYQRSVKHSLLISFCVWVLAVIQIGMGKLVFIFGGIDGVHVFGALHLLVPYPLIVFSYVGTKKALSHSISVPKHEQRRILRILALVLFNYTALFLPCKVFLIFFPVLLNHDNNTTLNCIRAVVLTLMYLNPLADCLLYVFMRRNTKEMISFCSYCERSRKEQDLEEDVPPSSGVESGDQESSI